MAAKCIVDEFCQMFYNNKLFAKFAHMSYNLMVDEIEIVKNLDCYKSLCKQIDNGVFFHAHLILSVDDFSNNNLALALALELATKHSDHAQDFHKAKMLAKSHPDIMVFDKGSFLTKDAQEIGAACIFAPVFCGCKIFVVYGFDNATLQAQNKLLKTLENPPANTYFLLCAKNEEKILKTIKSRCKLFCVERTSFERAKDATKLYDFDQQLYDGYLGSMLNKGERQTEKQALEGARKIFFSDFSSKDISDFASLCLSKEFFCTMLGHLQSYFTALLRMCLGQEVVGFDLQERQQMALMHSEFDVVALSNISKQIDKTKKMIDLNVGMQLLLNDLILFILEEKYLCKKR